MYKCVVFGCVFVKYLYVIVLFDVFVMFGGFEIVMMMGVYFVAVSEWMMIFVDGFIVIVVLFVVECIVFGVCDYCVFLYMLYEVGYWCMFEYFGVKLLFVFDLWFGEGMGVVFVLLLVCVVVVFLSEMVSFEFVGVDNCDV